MRATNSRHPGDSSRNTSKIQPREFYRTGHRQETVPDWQPSFLSSLPRLPEWPWQESRGEGSAERRAALQWLRARDPKGNLPRTSHEPQILEDLIRDLVNHSHQQSLSSTASTLTLLAEDLRRQIASENPVRPDAGSGRVMTRLTRTLYDPDKLQATLGTGGGSRSPMARRLEALGEIRRWLGRQESPVRILHATSADSLSEAADILSEQQGAIAPLLEAIEFAGQDSGQPGESSAERWKGLLSPLVILISRDRLARLPAGEVDRLLSGPLPAWIVVTSGAADLINPAGPRSPVTPLLTRPGIFTARTATADMVHMAEAVIRMAAAARPAMMEIIVPEEGLPREEVLVGSRALTPWICDPAAGKRLYSRLDLSRIPENKRLCRGLSVPVGEDKFPTFMTPVHFAAGLKEMQQEFLPAPDLEPGDGFAEAGQILAKGGPLPAGLQPYIHGRSRDGREFPVLVTRRLMERAARMLAAFDQLQEMGGLVNDQAEQILRAAAAERQQALVAQKAELDLAWQTRVEAEKPVIVRQTIQNMVNGILLRGGGNGAVPQAAPTVTGTVPSAPVVPAAPVAPSASAAPAAPSAPAVAVPPVDTPATTPTAGHNQPPLKEAIQPSPLPDPATGAATATLSPAPARATTGSTAVAVQPQPSVAATEEIESWVDTEICTSCDDCVSINDRLFLYNEEQKVYLGDPASGTFAELVRAAEKCPAECIHPGTPLQGDATGTNEMIRRALPFRE